MTSAFGEALEWKGDVFPEGAPLGRTEKTGFGVWMKMGFYGK